jgi:hypothetical protein
MVCAVADAPSTHGEDTTISDLPFRSTEQPLPPRCALAAAQGDGFKKRSSAVLAPGHQIRVDDSFATIGGFRTLAGSEEVNDALKMIRRRRPAVWILLLVGLLLAVVAGAGGAYLALKHSGSDREEGFLAHGQVSAAIFGVDVDTAQSRRCLAKSDQAATTIRQGIPVTISLNGTAVGVGHLSVGHLTREPVHQGNPGSLRASCLYTFTAPVTEKSEGKFTVDIGTATVPFSMDDLRNGVNIGLS